MELNFYCNKHAKYQPIDFIRISFFVYIVMHSFLCIGAHFSVQIKQQLLNGSE